MSGGVFLSYSHKDEMWKEQLRIHLGFLQRQFGIDIWDDKRIKVGENWEKEIESALSEARIAVLLLSAEYLSSEFVARKEIPEILDHYRKRGLKIVPILVRHCAWELIPWLSALQIRPKGPRPLSAMSENESDEALSQLAIEVHKHLAGSATPALASHSLAAPTPVTTATPPISTRPSRPAPRRTWHVIEGTVEPIELKVARGDIIEGQLVEEDEYPFGFFILHEKDLEFVTQGLYDDAYPHGWDDSEYWIAWKVPKKGPWYLVLDARNKQYGRDIRVNLKFATDPR